MASVVINIKHIKKCAFCKYWYDPANSAIAPRDPKIGLWEIKNINQKSFCTKKSIPMIANAFCNDGYEEKV